MGGGLHGSMFEHMAGGGMAGGGMPGMRFSSMPPGAGGGGSPFAAFAGGMPGMNGSAGRTSRGGPSPAGPGAFPQQQQAVAKPPPIEVPLACTLEELFSGATKQRKLTRRVWNDASGSIQQVEEKLTIQIKAGWKAGTKVRFDDKGDVLSPGAPAADIVFVVSETPHATFQRKGNDLVTWVPVPLADALQPGGCTVAVPTIEGRTLRVHAAGAQLTGGASAAVVIPNEGMPITAKNAPHHGARGNLLVHVDVRLPVGGVSDSQRASFADSLRAANYDLSRKPPSDYA